MKGDFGGAGFSFARRGVLVCVDWRVGEVVGERGGVAGTTESADAAFHGCLVGWLDCAVL